MRLLHKTTLDLTFFLSDALPPYLILSHRWQGAETNLQEFLAQRHLPSAQQSPGTIKVVRFCAEVADRAEEYVWVDTACIDKTSSAELQEAINSMYAWYQRAARCYVLLDDVRSKDLTTFERSRWFRRGWTLQELLAPAKLDFVDADWVRIGDRTELGPRIQAITGIQQACLGSEVTIRSTPVAQRMSWLSKRQTSRVEDLAYCMLGIFGVNMTMLYGEGNKAFMRLQREIVNTINDESIFLWSVPTDNVKGLPASILAPMPECFAVCGALDIKISNFFDREPYRMTTRGLDIELFGRRHEMFATELNVVLNCKVDGKRARVPIQRVHTSPTDPNDWHRILEKRVSTLEAHQYDPPPSMWQDFNDEYERLNGFGHAAAINRKIMYRDEVTRFKVYIA